MKYIIFFLLLPVFANAQSSLLKYEWRKISGPANYIIASPSARDTMKATVQPVANKLQSKFYQTEVVAFIRNNNNKAMVN